jgi:hypothetical protein
MSRLHRFVPFTVLSAIFACGTFGCAFGDRRVETTYRPVMSIKARAPQAVDVPPFASKRGLKNEAQIGQVRNNFGMVTAKVFTKSGDAAGWVRRALNDELAAAGYTVNRGATPATPAATVINGTLEEFMSDVGFDGFSTRLRVRLVVTQYGTARLDKSFDVEDGGSGLTASAGEYQEVCQAALTKLMRRAVPEVIAAIER